MPRYTDRWGLSILGPGDTIQADGFKFSDADIRLLDRILAYAAENHHHTGETGTDNTPTAGLNLQLDTTGGSMPSGTRWYYRYTIVDSTGNESAPSPVQSIDMPLAVSHPAAPSPLAVTGTGDLEPGTYSYVCSAYREVSTLETKAVNSAAIKIPGADPHNSVTLTLPDVPIGGTGLNVYRKTPSGLHYLYITSIDAPTTGQMWTDDGTVAGDCDRSLPAVNRTSNDNMVTVAYPGATPTIPAGWSWRIYRTGNATDWSRSYLTELVPQGATPSTPLVYPDVGSAPQVGGPPTASQVINAPPKIDLTDAAEVQGELPPGRVITPHVISFSSPGPVIVGDGTFQWVCEYDEADILQVRAYLGVDSTPAATDVIVDVNVSRPGQGLPGWDSIFDSGPDRPRITVGETVGEPAVPSITRLVEGDLMTVDCDQAGGGATPTDENLTIAVMLYVKHGSETESYIWT